MRASRAKRIESLEPVEQAPLGRAEPQTRVQHSDGRPPDELSEFHEPLGGECAELQSVGIIGVRVSPSPCWQRPARGPYRPARSAACASVEEGRHLCREDVAIPQPPPSARRRAAVEAGWNTAVRRWQRCGEVRR